MSGLREAASEPWDSTSGVVILEWLDSSEVSSVEDDCADLGLYEEMLLAMTRKQGNSDNVIWM